ncbi:MAG: MFS transporter, partial [Alphaproteobacteria bacterium]|nr:MFS transporter [Alphaproteobacteria bacterium]
MSALSPAMPRPSPLAVQSFSNIGHFYNHLFEPMFFVVALVLPPVLGIPYEEVITLILAGKITTGVLSPVVGWLADRWSVLGMMVIYFIGFGASGIWVGLSESPAEMRVALVALGAFGSIYHPVGIAWVAQSSVNRGRALGVNGMFGGLGPALGGVFAGLMIDVADWRTSFVVPGALVIATGAALVWFHRRGIIRNEPLVPNRMVPMAISDAVKIYLVLTVAMLLGSVSYQAAQSSLPKLFEMEAIGPMFGEGTSGIGTAIMIVYGVGGIVQVFTGHLADKYPLKWVYTAMIFIQGPVLALAATLAGVPLFLAAIMMVTCNIGALPAENALMAKYTPGKW